MIKKYKKMRKLYKEFIRKKYKLKCDLKLCEGRDKKEKNIAKRKAKERIELKNKIMKNK